MFVFIVFNYYSLKVSGVISTVTTVLKFVPLVAIILSGIVYAIIQQDSGLFNPSNSGNIQIATNPSFQLIIAALPSVLFAYDSFLNIGNLALDIKKPEKNVSLTTIIGMSLCAVFYILVTVSQILIMNGNGMSFFENDFFGSKEVQKGLSIAIRVFICISIIGVLNSFSASIIRSFKSLIDEKIIFNAEFFIYLSSKFKSNDKQGFRPGVLLLCTVSIIWSLIIFIPSIFIGGPLGTDALLDGISNFPTLFFFLVYGSLVVGALVNRFTNKVEVTKTKLFWLAAPIAIIGITIVFCYLFFYQYLTLPFIMQENDPNFPFKWGLFFDKGFKTKPWMASLCFFLALITFFALPFINLGLRKLMIKRYQTKGIES